MDNKYLMFELEDKTVIKIKNDEKLYRIGLRIDGIDRIETFYSLYPTEIQKYIKKYNGILVYLVEM